MTTDKVKEILRQQRELCFIAMVNNGFNSFCQETIINAPEPTVEPEVSAEEVVDIKAKEFFEGVLNMGWMSEEEKQTIYDAAELYAQGRLRHASLSKKEVGEEKDLEVGLGNSGNASVASHSSGVGNSIEQILQFSKEGLKDAEQSALLQTKTVTQSIYYEGKVSAFSDVIKKIENILKALNRG
jgi:hypothetical protein